MSASQNHHSLLLSLTRHRSEHHWQHKTVKRWKTAEWLELHFHGCQPKPSRFAFKSNQAQEWTSLAAYDSKALTHNWVTWTTVNYISTSASQSHHSLLLSLTWHNSERHRQPVTALHVAFGRRSQCVSAVSTLLANVRSVCLQSLDSDRSQLLIDWTVEGCIMILCLI